MSNSKVLCSIGAGPHEELLNISSETFANFALRHGYDLELRHDAPPDRPAPWAKIPLMQQMLGRYDLVLWIDADAAVVDCSMDIADLLETRDLMGMVAHRTPEGVDPIPNSGVMVLRSRRRVRRFLEDVWGSTQYLHHKWWENAAILDRLGYSLEPKVQLHSPTAMYRRTRFLSTEWNRISEEDRSGPTRIVHFPGLPLPERIAGLEAAAEKCRSQGG
jgi:galactosyl transferase GMA12/MNN10 family